MSFWPMKKIEPAFTYPAASSLMPCADEWTRITWAVQSLGGYPTGMFFYKPDVDKYYLLAQLNWEWCFFGSIILAAHAQSMYEFNAETLEFEQRYDTPFSVVGPWGMMGINLNGSITVGSYNRFYMINMWIPQIVEYNANGSPTGWSLMLNTLPNIPPIFIGPSQCIVNKQSNILALAGFWYNFGGKAIMFWKDFETANPVYLGSIYLPSAHVFNLAWESDRYFWVIWEGGRLAKIDMHLRRVELYSKIDFEPGVDFATYVAWDTKRGRLTVMRHKYDAGYPIPLGDARNSIETYRPIPVPSILTKPVPTAPLRTNKTIPFTFHLLGDAGEGITPHTINASLTDPVDGSLARSFVQTREYGWGTINYYAPDISCSENLALEAIITEVPTI